MRINSSLIFLSIVSTSLYATEQENQTLGTDLSNAQIAAPATCSNISNANIDIEAVKTKYEGLMNAEKTKIEDGINGIKSKAPDPNGFEGALGITFHFRDEVAEFALDLPTVTMVDQKMSMDIPETTMKTQTWSWDFPETRMKLQCVPGIPETVVTTGTCDVFGVKFSCPQFEIRAGKDMCTDVPEFTMVRKEIKLDIPEFTMKRQDWVMGVPEIKMETMRMSFTYPALVVDDIKAKSKELSAEAEALASKSKDTLYGISAAMKSEMTLASMASVNKGFDCQKKALSSQIRKAYDDLNALQEGAKASVERATAMHASKEALDALSASTVRLMEAKHQLLIQYVKARRDIESKRKDVLVKMKDALNEKPVSEVAVAK